MKDFTIRDLLVGEKSDNFSSQYRTGPAQSLYTCFNHCSDKDRLLINSSLVRSKQYLNSLVTEHWPKSSASNLKRSVTACSTYLSNIL